MEQDDLISRAGQGDEAAFEELVRAYERKVYQLCLRMTGDREDALDLSQETFLKAWHAISLFQGESKFSTWLLRIASNTCIDHLRREKRKKAVSLTGDDQLLEMEIADFDADPARLLERAQSQEAVREAMARLAPEDRMLLSLRAVEDMSYREIGEAMDIAQGTVKSRMARAREKLRRLLAGNFSEKSSSIKVKGGETE